MNVTKLKPQGQDQQEPTEILKDPFFFQLLESISKWEILLNKGHQLRPLLAFGSSLIINVLKREIPYFNSSLHLALGYAPSMCWINTHLLNKQLNEWTAVQHGHSRQCSEMCMKDMQSISWLKLWKDFSFFKGQVKLCSIFGHCMLALTHSLASTIFGCLPSFSIWASLKHSVQLF